MNLHFLFLKYNPLCVYKTTDTCTLAMIIYCKRLGSQNAL